MHRPVYQMCPDYTGGEGRAPRVPNPYPSHSDDGFWDLKHYEAAAVAGHGRSMNVR